MENPIAKDRPIAKSVVEDRGLCCVENVVPFVLCRLWLMNHPHHSSHQKAARAMPPGTPAWITQAMIDQTLAVWQPYYCTPLTAEDAVAMLIHVGHLFRALRKDAAPPH